MLNFGNPHENLMCNLKGKQCPNCYFIEKEETWHCKGMGGLQGSHPCHKSEELLCPLAGKNHKRKH